MSVRVALLTAPGRSALASLAVEGANAWDLLRPLFRSMSGQERTTAPEGGRFRLGKLGLDVADEVVLAHVGERFEIHCHGGREVVRVLMEALADRGAQIVGWQDLMANAALECLSFAPTVRTATILLDQHRGAWRTAVRRIIAGLPDDQELRLLASRVPLGLHLTNPWKVTLAGAPNAGKSSLVNALAGYTRSIVAPTPGTTRDLVRVPVALDGWPVELIDTAGLRDSTEMIEATGIAQARREIESADLCVWVVDATAENPQWPGQTPKPTIIAINKVEAVPAWNISNVPGVCRVSAHTGAGVSELAARMIAALVPEVPEPGAAVPHTLEQGRAVLAALAYLEGGQVEEAREVLKRYSEE